MARSPLLLTRREFSIAVGAPLVFAPSSAQGQPTRAVLTAAVAREVYRRSIAIDGLASPNAFNVNWPPRDQPLTAAQLENVRQSGLTAINLTVSDFTYEETVAKIAYWAREMTLHPERLRLVRSTRDIAQSKNDGVLGLMLGFQFADMLGRDVSRVDVFYHLGVRVVQLTYNDRNFLGDGCLEPGNAGLSAFGRDVVARMNELGTAVDLSHCGTQTTADGIAASRGPVLITHSGCREVYRHPRNKEDRELRALAERGGVIGIFLMPFLGGTGAATIDVLMRHVEHALNVCGADHVGIGSDLSISPVEESPDYVKAKAAFTVMRTKRGIVAPDEDRPLYVPELNYPRRLEGIAVALAARGHSSAVIEKVIGGNFYRALSDIWRA
ncbi:MAG: dipeptidase [Acidobacteria bacterium]|nr:dipeptidase [Acidobacteriota bacterium]MCA1652057.1 dipeptidase [Acidobacteriota bacterium]